MLPDVYDHLFQIRLSGTAEKAANSLGGYNQNLPLTSGMEPNIPGGISH
jgi:hypothetical protein